MKNENPKSDLYIRIAYFASLTGVSVLLGFSWTMNRIHKAEPKTRDAKLFQEGVSLARKALFRGSLHALFWVGLLSAATGTLIHVAKLQPIKPSDEDELKNLQEAFGVTKKDLLGANNEE